jgi:hypothetical protein
VAAAVSGGLGVALLVVAITAASGAARRVRYRPRPLTALDRQVMGAVLVAPIGLALLGTAGDRSLTWTPTGAAFPPFHPLVVLALLALSVPAIVGRSRT